MVRIPRTTVVALTAVLCCAVLAGDLSAASPKERIRAKERQAQAVLAQVSALDQRFEASVEAWHGAQYELQLTKKQLAIDRRALRIASAEKRVALARVRARVVALYEDPSDTTTLGIFLGSTSVSGMLDRLDAAHQVEAADHRLAVQTAAARSRYAAAVRRTTALERQREDAVARRDSERRQIGTMLGEQKRLLASVQAEVVTMRAAEARRQAKLAAEAKARLAAQQAALRQQAAEQAAAARAAKEAAAARQAQAPPKAPPATTTTAAAPPPATTTTATTTTQPPPTTTTAPAPPPADPPSVPATPTGSGHPEAATMALRYLGVPYVWGGATPSGFDCSGLVMYVYAQLGISLPHFAAAQYGMGSPVARSDLQPGDLVFFDALNHVGIYIGDGQLVHAPQTGDVVKISSLSDFGDSYVGARRL
jgi:peptidoglycan DL-endopeptidase CwlO